MDLQTRRIGAGAAVLMLVAAPLAAQTWERGGDGWCEERRGDRERACHTLTATFAAPSRLEIDGGLNGGIEVVGWGGDEVRVVARVWARARDLRDAEALARDVRIVVDGGRLRAEGADARGRESWGVGWQVRVPYETDLDLRSHNGGIAVEEVSGDIRFDDLNGGVRLVGVGGDVRGETTNGGLHIELAGDRWDGAGLDARTTNGGVRLVVPDGYSADLETGTVNGGFDIDFPITIQGRIGRSLETTLGDGGPLVRATTTNGGVKILRSATIERR